MADDNGVMPAVEESGQRLVRRWRDEPRLRKVPVVVCTTAGIFVGDTYRLEEQRLLDALNRGFVARALRMAGDFMPLTAVEAYLPNGRKTSLASIHVQKASILFVGEKGCGPQETVAGIREYRKTQLLRNKTYMGAELHVPPYVLEGCVYVETWGELPEAVETDTRFLPLTRVKIRPVLSGGESTSGFVAVNKNKILYITESTRQA